MLMTYLQLCARGCLGQVWAALIGRSGYLLSLAEMHADGTACARRAAGMQTVPIARIRGSEGRSRDFDRSFNPLGSHGMERWLRVAEAQQRGVALPLVQLIRVGELYFVRDGHHRISVARALGQREIDAEVVVWEVDEPLAWGPLPARPGLAEYMRNMLRRPAHAG
jgi:hypothetical protein